VYLPPDPCPLLYPPHIDAPSFPLEAGQVWSFHGDEDFDCSIGDSVIYEGRVFHEVRGSDAAGLDLDLLCVENDTVFVVWPADTTATTSIEDWRWFWPEFRASWPWPIFPLNAPAGTTYVLFSKASGQAQLTYSVQCNGPKTMVLNGRTVTDVLDFALIYTSTFVHPDVYNNWTAHYYVRRGIGLVAIAQAGRWYGPPEGGRWTFAVGRVVCPDPD
jgi:hypothetical protein